MKEKGEEGKRRGGDRGERGGGRKSNNNYYEVLAFMRLRTSILHCCVSQKREEPQRMKNAITKIQKSFQDLYRLYNL